jgi:hypothetical protein
MNLKPARAIQWDPIYIKKKVKKRTVFLVLNVEVTERKPKILFAEIQCVFIFLSKCNQERLHLISTEDTKEGKV